MTKAEYKTVKATIRAMARGDSLGSIFRLCPELRLFEVAVKMAMASDALAYRQTEKANGKKLKQFGGFLYMAK
jgi:hypothetical protein